MNLNWRILSALLFFSRVFFLTGKSIKVFDKLEFSLTFVDFTSISWRREKRDQPLLLRGYNSGVLLSFSFAQVFFLLCCKRPNERNCPFELNKVLLSRWKVDCVTTFPRGSKTFSILLLLLLITRVKSPLQCWHFSSFEVRVIYTGKKKTSVLNEGLLMGSMW